uniref:Uncharacterized protein n=1 Tax=Megaselia scalaris TaxID=36166 RepID=T1H213_MEGSC
MKLVVFAALFAVAIAAPSDKDAQTLRSDAQLNTDDFRVAVETSNGIKQEAEGELKQIDAENSAVIQRGSYNYIGDDGQTYQVDWTADEY